MFYFILCVLGGMFIPNVEIVINWTASVQIVIIGYLSPAAFYNLARKKYPQNVDKANDRFVVWNTWFQYVLAVVTFAMGMFINIIAIYDPKTPE